MRRVSLVVLAGLGLLLAAAPIRAAVSLTDVVVPQYVEAANSSTRLPAVFRVTLAGLTPGATYRYFMQAVVASDGATVSGAGNSLFLDGPFRFYTSSPGMSTVGTTCAELTANAAGEYTCWMAVVPTGNTRFTAGNTISLRVMLNDGAGGTSVATRVTATNGCTTVAFGTTPNDATGIEQTASAFSAGNVVVLYGDADGTGRPLTTAIVQDDGVTLPSSVAYYAALDATASAWGTLVPNNLASGVMRIEERDNATGNVLHALSDADGIWNPGAVSTVNPAGGTNAIDLTGVETQEPVPASTSTFGQLKAKYR